MATDNLTPEQVGEIRNYWESGEFGTYSDPIFQFIPEKERRELERFAVRQFAQMQHQTEEEFREKTLGESLSGPRFDSVWGGKVAVETVRNFALAMDSRLSVLKDFAWNAICVKLDYCAKRKKGIFEKEGPNLAIAVADALLSIHTQIPMPITMASVYIIKRGLLDKWCKCNKTE